MALVAALITGACTLIGQFIASGRSLRKPGSLRLTWRGVLGILLVVVGSVSVFFFVRHLITQSPQAAVTPPAGVTTGSVIEGSASGLPHDQLFLVLRSTEGGGLLYYPQSQVSDWTGANWSAQLKDLPGAGSYDLIAVAVTTSEASGEMRMYIQVCQTVKCPGVDIPEGVETLASVPVIISSSASG